MSYRDNPNHYGRDKNAVDPITGFSLLAFFACMSALMLIAAIPKPAPARSAPPVGRAHPVLCDEKPCLQGLQAASPRPRFTRFTLNVLNRKHFATFGRKAAHRGVVKPPTRHRSH